MISVCYLIVCVNLLYFLDQAETFSPNESTYRSTRYKQSLLLQSLTEKRQDEYLAKIICPYWNLTYDKQLDIKQKKTVEIVNTLTNHSRSLGNPVKCEVLKIVPSPVTKAYRNTDQFKILTGVDGNPKTVGIEIGKVSLGNVFAFRPTLVVTVRESHKTIAQVYEDFIRLSPLPASYSLYDGGHWKSLLVRSNVHGEVMAAVTVQPTGYSNETIEVQKHALKEYFYKRLPNITLFHQQWQVEQNSFKKINLMYNPQL